MYTYRMKGLFPAVHLYKYSFPIMNLSLVCRLFMLRTARNEWWSKGDDYQISYCY